MTKEKQIIAIAELDGWKQTKGDKESLVAFEVTFGKNYITNPELHGIPDYLTSRDAIIPVIENLDEETFVRFQSHLCQIIAKEYNTLTHLVTFRMMFEATPAQLAEALLRATGKWEE